MALNPHVGYAEVKPCEKTIVHTCNICTEDFDKKSTHSAYLTCLCWYHGECIASWFGKQTYGEFNKTCPTCRDETKDMYLVRFDPLSSNILAA